MAALAAEHPRRQVAATLSTAQAFTNDHTLEFGSGLRSARREEGGLKPKFCLFACFVSFRCVAFEPIVRAH